MSIVQPDVNSWQDVDQIFPYGTPLVTRGLVNFGAVDGFGVLTLGLLWEMRQIWFDSHFYSGVSTSWSVATGSSGITTNWSVATGTSGIVTTWTPERFGIWGEYNP